MVDYQNLSQLISDNSEWLRKKLLHRELPVDAEVIKKYCVEYIVSLTKSDAQYMVQLSLLEQDILLPILNIMNIMNVTDIDLANKMYASFRKSTADSNKKQTSKQERSIKKEYGTAFVGAAGGTLFATICKPSSWGVILLGSVISAIIGKVLYGVYVDKNNNVIAKVGDTETLPRYILTEKDIDIIVKSLVNVGENIDKVLLTYRNHIEILRKENSLKIASFELDKKYIGLLECYQTILGNIYSMNSNPIIKDTIKQINRTLSVQGYKAIHFNENAKDMFEVKYDDRSQIEEFKPAIVKLENEKEIVVLKGDVVLPN